MRRRRFVAAMLAVPLAAAQRPARAQQPRRLPRVGWLNVSTADINEPIYASFKDRLAERGYVADRTVIFDDVHGDGRLDRLEGLARELVTRRPDVIAVQTLTGLLPLTAATATIPIVLVAGNDPVAAGLTTSLARPSRNITGFSTLSEALVSKRIDYLRQVAPAMRRIAFVHGEHDAGAAIVRAATEAVARTMGLTLISIAAPDAAGAVAALRSAMADPPDALIVNSDAVVYPAAVEIAALAAERRVPATYTQRQMAVDGGLMAVAFDPFETVRGAADYVARILAGTPVAELPFQQSLRITFVINLASAQRAGIAVPATLIALADEVIE